VIVDRDEKLAASAEGELRAVGHNVTAETCDVANAGQVADMMARVVSTYGRLDAAFNNAGINTESAPLLETEDDEFDQVMRINVRGV
jgi:NAD(P)-dependent dehydrogenase (short-subunit alcohol dehydrogenase family)